MKSVRRKASRMNTLLSAIFKFCTTNQLFKLLIDCNRNLIDQKTLELLYYSIKLILENTLLEIIKVFRSIKSLLQSLIDCDSDLIDRKKLYLINLKLQ